MGSTQEKDAVTNLYGRKSSRTGKFNVDYQWWLILMCGSFEVICGFHIVSSVFIQAVPMFDRSECDTVDYDDDVPSNITTDRYNNDTLVTEFNLYCQNRILQFITTLYFTGYGIGAFTGGFIIDNYGRKITILIAVTTILLASILGSFSPNWWIYAICRSFIGLGCNMAIQGERVLAYELVSNRHRSKVVGFATAWFNIGMSLVPIIAYFLISWRKIEFYSNILLVPNFIFLYYLIPESPKFLLLKCKFDEARNVINEIRHKNGAEKLTDKEFYKGVADFVDDDNEDNGLEKITQKTYTTLDLFKNGRSLSKITLTLAMQWFIVSICYYSVCLSPEDLRGNFYINCYFLNLAGVVSGAAVVYLTDSWLGRRLTYSIMSGLAGVSILLSEVLKFYSDSEILVTFSFILGKIFFKVEFLS